MATDSCCAEVPRSVIDLTAHALAETDLTIVAGKLNSLIKEYSGNNQITDDNTTTSSKKTLYDVFMIKSSVQINMEDYLNRIQKYTNFENPLFVAALL